MMKSSFTQVHLRYKIGFQRDGVVVREIVGGAHECHRARSRCLQERAPRLGFAVAFRERPPVEFGPLVRIAHEPGAELVAGYHVLEPAIERERRFLHLARPQPIH